MGVDDIKKAIQELPDKEIEPLLNWLREYYDGPVWDRQMEADIEEVGADRLFAALMAEPVQQDDKHQAVLRLMNAMQFRSDADREQVMKDFALVMGQALEGDNSVFGELVDLDPPMPGTGDKPQ